MAGRSSAGSVAGGPIVGRFSRRRAGRPPSVRGTAHALGHRGHGLQEHVEPRDDRARQLLHHLPVAAERLVERALTSLPRSSRRARGTL
jgi:hypothetical protein